MRDLQARTEVSVAASPLGQRYPVSNASGAAVAFSVYENDTRAVYVAAPGGVPDKVCDGCLRATDWSRDQRTLVIFGGTPYHINLLDLASRRQIPLVRHPDNDVMYGRLSPDNLWISFTVRIEPARGRIMIAPADGAMPIPEQAWITIAEVEPDDYANWSPDGNTLYFTSGKDGYSCLWAQRIDGVSRKPVGDAFSVQHFHGRESFSHLGWAAAADRIAVPLVETTGDLWMMSRSR
jgi:Tol biopolymer transport system component